ncbi:MAG: NERD domain-containing protein [Cyclobacteriaceae bacterium]
MAKMIPHKAYSTGSEGELRVFEALHTLLPTSFTVLHSYRWISSENDRQSQGEADFVVFHPKMGILVIEVKAGIITLENRIWNQQNRNTGIKKEIRDPEEQAAASKFKIINFLKGIRGCLVCHAVWFPSVSFRPSELPPNYNSLMLLDESSLSDPEQAIQRAFGYWIDRIGISTNFDGNASELVMKRLVPSMHLVPSLELDFGQKEKKFLALTQEQCRILDFLQMQKKASISGVAGTGKTLIAIEKARQLQVNEGNVLFLCFNSYLADYLNKSYGHYGFKILTFDGLAISLIGSKGSFDKNRSLFLDYLLDENADFPYQHIVIDEGQDFRSEWLEYLDFRIDADAHFYVFYDQQQSLYKEELNQWLSQSPCRLTLTVNCRNTEAIAMTAYGSLGRAIGNTPILSGIEGEQPVLLPALEPKKLANLLDKVVSRFCTITKSTFDRVAIITMVTWEESLLSELTVHLKSPINSEGIKDKHIFVTTARKFKGLEADVVIIVDHDWQLMEDIKYRRLFYTSASRAKHELFITSPDLNEVDVDTVLQFTIKDTKRKGKRKFLKAFNLKEYHETI